MSKIFIFGDSYAKCFKELNSSPNIIVKYYGGKSAKGINKEIGEDIIKILEKNSKDICCIIILFGQVDIHFSYYYKTIEHNTDFLYDGVINNYIDFIIKLKKYTSEIYVINILPNTAEPVEFRDMLVHANTISEKNKNSKKLIDMLIIKNQIKRLKKINDLLKKKCDQIGVAFLNCNKYILQSNKINPIYITKTKYDLHVIWETFIILILKKYKTCLDTSMFPKLLHLINYSDKKFIEYINTLY